MSLECLSAFVDDYFRSIVEKCGLDTKCENLDCRFLHETKYSSLIMLKAGFCLQLTTYRIDISLCFERWPVSEQRSVHVVYRRRQSLWGVVLPISGHENSVSSKVPLAIIRHNLCFRPFHTKNLSKRKLANLVDGASMCLPWKKSFHRLHQSLLSSCKCVTCRPNGTGRPASARTEPMALLFDTQNCWTTKNKVVFGSSNNKESGHSSAGRHPTPFK